MYGEKKPFYGNPTKERDGRAHATAKKAAYCLYRNLHTSGWSLRFKGKVIEHLPADEAVIFDSVVFPRVEQAGKKRAMAEQQRNVHAYLCSHEKPTVVKNADYAREIIERMGFRRVSYSPFSDLGWHYVDHKTPFHLAEGAILLGGREVWVPTRFSGYRENPECPSFVRKRLKRYFYVRDGQINPDWIEELQAGDVVRIAPHDSAACNYTLTKLDKASDLVEYTDRFDGKPKTSTWSAFLETLKKSWKAELAAFVKAGIERRKERIARAKKRGSKTQIEKAEQELARFKSAYGKEGLKKSAPPPDPEVVPEEEKPKKTKKIKETKEVSVEEFFEDLPSEVGAVSTKATKPKKTAAKGGKGGAGEVKVTPTEIPAAPDSEGWLKVDHVRVATVMENNAPSGFETYGYEKGGLSYYRNADGAWEVMHQASGLRLHVLPSEVDARMFAENVLEVKIPPLDVLTSSEDALSASKKKVRATFLLRVHSLKQTQEAVQEVVEKAQASEVVDEEENEESEEEATEAAENPHLSMGQTILSWWKENKASIASGGYGDGDYRATIHALQQIAGFERKARLGEQNSVDTSHVDQYKRRLGDLYKKELSHLRSLSGLGASWFSKKSDIVAFARTFIPMILSGWTENTSIQEAVRDLANLLLPIEEIEPLLNVSDHGDLPAWVYLYHVERIAQELGLPIHYDAETAKSTTKSLGVLGGAVQLWKAFASEANGEKSLIAA